MAAMQIHITCEQYFPIGKFVAIAYDFAWPFEQHGLRTMVDLTLGIAGAVASRPSRPDVNRAILIATAGNLLESFDFVVFAYLAGVIATNFFPSADETASLLATFATFGVGFLARPLGGFAFGWIGDRRGRKVMLMWTLSLMAVATLAIGILPTYSMIGVAAPCLLVLARVCQGLSLGGESMGSVAFIVEWAPEGRRGFIGSFQQVGSGLGLLLGSLTVAVLSTALSAHAFQTWGWRIPFLLGVVVGLVGLLIRTMAHETPAFLSATAQATMSPAIPRGVLGGLAFKAFIFTLFWSIGFYFFLSYMPTFAQRQLQISGMTAIWVNTFMLAIYILAVPCAGLASDKIGRKPVLLASCLGFALICYPVFRLLLSEADLALYVPAVAVFAVALAMYTGPAPATIAEMFPTRHRSRWMAIGYSASVALSGFTPYIAVWSIAYFDTPLAPVYGVMASAIVGGLFLLSVGETARQTLQ
jgi:MHS family proline/betaine transporter-like MFS transporter